jgi:light-regulated signal transduction histidine kinase (bacteriophytochrome)
MSVDAIRFGEVDLTTCDREPIHIPGSIQPHGVLLVVDRQELVIEQVAGDTRLLLGVDPPRLPGQPVAALLDAEGAAFVGAQLQLAAAFVAPITRLGVRSRLGPLALDLTLHAIERTALLELEPARRDSGGGADPIAQLKTLLAAVQVTASVDASCAAAATALRAATGFDRAMVYRFLPDQSGVIVAENARAGLESFLGLHYPASDIPQQARELYRRNWLRTIADIDYVAAPLQPALNRRTRQPIDMSHCALRSVSPIHLEYLRNMGVSASLSASIVCQDRLWGMLVLHHYSPRYVAADVRAACETFAQMFSLHVEAKSQAETTVLRLQARRELEQLFSGDTDARDMGPMGDMGAVIARWNLPRYLGAAGCVVYLDGRQHRIGQAPAAADIDALLRWLNGVNRPLFATGHLAAQYPPAAAFPELASGLVAVRLSREPRDYVMWFRPEIGLTVRWAGDPSKSVKVGPLGERLTPRGSFAEWREVTRMQSAPWSEVDLEAAEALRGALLEWVLRGMDMARREQLELHVAQRTEQLRKLAADLDAAEERERQQIARDLHDDLGQVLAAARIRLSHLCASEHAQVRATADSVAALIDRACDSTRSLAAQMAPAMLHELGLCPALEWLGEEIERTFGLKVTVIDDGREKPLSHEVRATLYRAVRELLINVAKHAHTDAARVESLLQHACIEIRVADAGVGYDAGATPGSGRRGLGLISVRERLALIGGSAQLLSTPGTGTVAVLSAPLSADRPAPEARAP